MSKMDIVDALQAVVEYKSDNRITAGLAKEEIKSLRAEIVELKEKLKVYTDPPRFVHREEGP